MLPNKLGSQSRITHNAITTLTFLGFFGILIVLKLGEIPGWKSSHTSDESLNLD